MPKRGRILWANAYCLLDTSSGAAVSTLAMLQGLSRRGWTISVLGATVFDHPDGVAGLGHRQWKTLRATPAETALVDDGVLEHRLVQTASTFRSEMTSAEEGCWFRWYTRMLDEQPPDMVMYYGGQVMDFLVADEARARGIPAIAFLHNGSYQGLRWCRDVSLVLTNSRSTSEMYRKRLGISSVPVGAFVDEAPVVAERHERRHVLFVNPSLEKGAAVVIKLAMMLEQRRPDIVFEVVESRGKWGDLLWRVSRQLGQPCTELSNVWVTPHQRDMRPVYGRARLLLAPSLWWEAFGRVIAEALFNGIPAIVSGYGALPEVIGNAGVVLNLPDVCHQPPYVNIPAEDRLEPVVQCIEKWFDSEQTYQMYVDRAYQQAKFHHMNRNLDALETALAGL